MISVKRTFAWLTLAAYESGLHHQKRIKELAKEGKGCVSIAACHPSADAVVTTEDIDQATQDDIITRADENITRIEASIDKLRDKHGLQLPSYSVAKIFARVANFVDRWEIACLERTKKEAESGFEFIGQTLDDGSGYGSSGTSAITGTSAMIRIDDSRKRFLIETTTERIEELAMAVNERADKYGLKRVSP